MARWPTPSTRCRRRSSTTTSSTATARNCRACWPARRDSKELSGLLASPALDRFTTFAGPVHFNADFSGQTSDHDPLLAYFDIPSAR
jgi:hypothetical protein